MENLKIAKNLQIVEKDLKNVKDFLKKASDFKLENEAIYTAILIAKMDNNLSIEEILNDSAMEWDLN